MRIIDNKISTTWCQVINAVIYLMITWYGNITYFVSILARETIFTEEKYKNELIQSNKLTSKYNTFVVTVSRTSLLMKNYDFYH